MMKMSLPTFFSVIVASPKIVELLSKVRMREIEQHHNIQSLYNALGIAVHYSTTTTTTTRRIGKYIHLNINDSIWMKWKWKMMKVVRFNIKGWPNNQTIWKFIYNIIYNNNNELDDDAQCPVQPLCDTLRYPLTIIINHLQSQNIIIIIFVITLY